MDDFESESIETESQYHSYQGSEIPLYVRFMWACYYVLLIYYCVAYMFPSMQSEFGSRRSKTRGEPAAVSK